MMRGPSLSNLIQSVLPVKFVSNVLQTSGPQHQQFSTRMRVYRGCGGIAMEGHQKVYKGSVANQSGQGTT